MATKLNIITVCGSGAMSSSMLAATLTEMLEEQGYEVYATETMPGMLNNTLTQGNWDLIVYATPLDDDYGIPVLNGICLLTGIGVDEFKEDLLQTLRDIGKTPN